MKAKLLIFANVIRSAQVYLYLPIPEDPKTRDRYDSNMDEMMDYRWQKLWHSAEEVARILRDWPADYFQQVDPMICGPFWMIHLVLTLHYMLAADVNQRRRISSALDVITMSVSCLSNIWGTAQIMLREYFRRKFSK